MAYEPTSWKAGDIVTSAKLNKMEQGIANVVLIAHVDDNNTLDKTWQEIFGADVAYVQFETGSKVMVVNVFNDGDYYLVKTSNNVEYNTDSPDGYPSAGGTD